MPRLNPLWNLPKAADMKCLYKGETSGVAYNIIFVLGKHTDYSLISVFDWHIGGVFVGRCRAGLCPIRSF